ncbi:rhodanese-like domain-containing protein [Enterococcus rivorum]|nr:rhodanese-like domain-containing protein [Enterococcus rivorum]MBP2098775.1 rhodanese-related sulfurtransferase [Enterococcus rivorum]
MNRLSVKELKELMEIRLNEPVSIVDVREIDEFTLGHIPSAKNFPLSTLPETISKLNKEEPHYVICQHGIRSQSACGFLKQSGYNVINVSEGMSAWDGKVES